MSINNPVMAPIEEVSICQYKLGLYMQQLWKRRGCIVLKKYLVSVRDISRELRYYDIYRVY